jgi:DNA-binding GntR family transcriptional regulator
LYLTPTAQVQRSESPVNLENASTAAVTPRGGYERRWARVADDLREKISGGRWLPGDRLPTKSQLAATYDVSSGTVRFAIGRLTEQGLVVTRGNSFYVAAAAGAQCPQTAAGPLADTGAAAAGVEPAR